MRCRQEGELRAYLDGELADGPRAQVQVHLEQCPRCRARLETLDVARGAVTRQLAALDAARTPDTGRAWNALRARTMQHNGLYTWRDWLMKNKTWRGLATGAVALAMVVGVLSFAPARALAREFLSLFRVQKFAVVQVNPDNERMESAAETLENTLFVQEPEMIVDEAEITVASIEEAQAQAGFEVRMPQYLPGSEPSIRVKGRTEMSATLAPDGLKVLFELAGMDASQVPTDIGDGQMSAVVPASVMIATDVVTVVQVLEPVVEYPEGVDAALVGEAGLRLLGMSDEDAARLSQQIDWTNTLILPVPTDIAEVQQTSIAGEDAVLLIPQDDRSRQTLLWHKDGVIYVAWGEGGLQKLIEVAESMF